MEYASKTEIYQKLKKPLLERQRRARINKCLSTLKTLVAELQHNDSIMRMDKAEMLETLVIFMRQQTKHTTHVPLETFCNGYMNAVNEVSRVMASTTGMSVELGKSVMTHLGSVYKKLQQTSAELTKPLAIDCALMSITSATATASPASSGYHSDCESPAISPMHAPLKLWRPW